ncbi:MAG TPA: hypothetical protein VFM93_00200 [Candidatus Limnocylindria bacterium]|nr:hypothetical protein [Candidatus Limnocylindria bacterium]
MTAAVVVGWIVASARASGGLAGVLIVLASAALGYARPRRAAVLGLAAAAPAVAMSIVFDANASALLALVPALAGAYAGAIARVTLARGRAA